MRKLWAYPPGLSWPSSTATRRPERARRLATASPAIPDPITRSSKSVIGRAMVCVARRESASGRFPRTGGGEALNETERGEAPDVRSSKLSAVDDGGARRSDDRCRSRTRTSVARLRQHGGEDDPGRRHCRDR